MEPKFIFDNFLPSTATRRYCSRKFQQISGFNHLQSKIKARIFQNTDNTYNTVIVVSAKLRKFKVEANNKALVISVGNAVEKINNSIKYN